MTPSSEVAPSRREGATTCIVCETSIDAPHEFCEECWDRYKETGIWRVVIEDVCDEWPGADRAHRIGGEVRDPEGREEAP